MGEKEKASARGGLWRLFGLTLLTCVVWAALVGADMFFGWTRAPLAPRGDAAAFATAAGERLDAENRGSAVFVLIENGNVVAVHSQSRGAPVSMDSLYQVASLSKWVTAWGVMRLVDDGVLDLDAPVSTYLTRWRLPESPYNNEVTIRRILSHTAGFTDGLGYTGFAPGTELQSLEESLTQAGDAFPDVSGALRVGVQPGERWAYSGAGYTLLQLIIEEVTGESFNAYMKRALFAPLGMTSATYEPTPAELTRVVAFYDADGAPAPHFRYTGTAAASLYVSAADMTRFLQAQIARGNEPAGRGVLRPETLTAMAQPEARMFGMPFWGLGEMLYVPNGAGGFVIGHEGGNLPAINTTARFDPASGDGVIVLLTGAKSLASEIGGEWLFWKTGRADLFTLRLQARPVLVRVAIGWLVIVVIAIGFGLRARRRAAA